jgi:hypothetical protein
LSQSSLDYSISKEEILETIYLESSPCFYWSREWLFYARGAFFFFFFSIILVSLRSDTFSYRYYNIFPKTDVPSSSPNARFKTLSPRTFLGLIFASIAFFILTYSYAESLCFLDYLEISGIWFLIG